MTIERRERRPYSLEPISRRAYAERDMNVLRLAFPLYKRNPQLHITQAVQMTGLTSLQIQHFLGAPHESLLSEPIPRLDATNGAFNQSLELTEDEVGSFAFTRALLTAGFITHDITYWESLHSLYTEHDRVLPEPFADKLRLEAFLKAMRVTKHGNIDLLEQYREIATSSPISPARAEYIQEEEQFIIAKAGSIFIRIFSLWQQGKTAREIQEATGFSPMQIHNALGNARLKGKIPHPTEEEKFQRWRRANPNLSPSPRKGKPQSVEHTLHVVEGRKGKLTSTERALIVLTAKARKVIRDRNKVSLSEFYDANHKLFRMKHGDRRFLETIYAAWICRLDERDFSNAIEMKKRSFVELKDVIRIYQQVDPGIFYRRQKDIAFIADTIIGKNKKEKE